jgi:hypothetical protein
MNNTALSYRLSNHQQSYLPIQLRKQRNHLSVTILPNVSYSDIRNFLFQIRPQIHQAIRCMHLFGRAEFWDFNFHESVTFRV